MARFTNCGFFHFLIFVSVSVSALCVAMLAQAVGIADAGTGEVKLEGVITAVDFDAERIMLDVHSLTLSNGDPQQLKVAEIKTITFDKYTQYSVADPRTITKSNLKAGASVNVVGRDDGTGKTVRARIMLFPALEAAAVRELQQITISGGRATGRIAFTSFRDGNYDIYLIDDNGENLQQLTTDSRNDTQPAFSPDGSRVAFVSARDGNLEIYIMNVDGSHQVRLTNNSEADTYPSFSPDGQKIIFVSRHNLDQRGRPYIMNLDGSQLKAVSLNGNWSSGSDPVVGSTNRILYSNGAVFLADADGSNEKRLASGYGARISPDGSKIVYVRAANPGGGDVNYEIYCINADGSAETRLTDSPGSDENPAFSPDGTRIVFYSARRDGRQLYIMNADGTEVRRLTTTPGQKKAPSWGPFYTGAMSLPIVPIISKVAANEPPLPGPPPTEKEPVAPPAKAIEGTWKVVEGKENGAGKWTIGDDRILLMLPPGATQNDSYTIESQDVLLHGGNWILDFTLAYHGDSWPVEVSLGTGDPNPGLGNAQPGSFKFTLEPEQTRSQGGIVLRKHNGGLGNMGIIADAGGGPVQMVRIAYNRTKNRLQFFINGQPLIFWREDVDFLLPFPVRLVVRPSNAKEATAVKLVSFHLTQNAETELPSLPGLAFDGFKQQSAKPLPTGLMTTLQKLLAGADLDPIEKAHVLATLVLSEKITTGKISDEHWKAVTDFVTANYQKPQDHENISALSVLLPIATVSADESQRAEARVWSRRFFEPWIDAKYGMVRQPSDLDATMRRVALLDPALAAVTVSSFNPSIRLVNDLSSDLKEKDPPRLLALYLALMASDPHRSPAWLLPELRAFAPEYFKLRFDIFRDALEHEKFYTSDRSYSMMAYRLASTDLPTAMELWEKINKPEIKAEALEYIATVVPPEQAKKFDVKIEANLKSAIAEWKPSARNDSAVPEIIRLARWYFEHGRKDEASQLVNGSAIPKIGKLSSTHFRDEWAIARLLRDTKSPAAQEWLQRAQQAATALDKERTEPDQMGGEVYFAATSLVVPDLIERGRIDEALAMTEQLDPDILAMNFRLNMTRVIVAIAEKDFARALKLTELLPEGSRRGLFASLAIKRAKTDLPAALALLGKLPIETRSSALFRIAEFAPLEKNPLMAKLLGESIAAKLAARKSQRVDTDYDLIDQLSKLQLPTLLALEPYFKDGRLYFLRPLLLVSGRAAGLQNEPLWQRFAATEKQPYGTSIPWGVDKLGDAIRAEKANAERANDEQK